MSTERIIVHSSIAEKFKVILRETVNKMFATVEDTPILVTAESVTRNRSLIDDALSKGARKLDLFSDSPDAGHESVKTRMRPVILERINKSMDLYAGESFGASVSWYTYETEDEMIELANDTEYGLAASIYAEDLRAAFRVADRLDSGAIHINSMTVHDEFSLPHGGVKKSGFGRFNGTQGLDEFLYCKTVTWME
jgi:acyl-CoA reductase-like NAD-dependent aldehyde dehydrogenase